MQSQVPRQASLSSLDSRRASLSSQDSRQASLSSHFPRPASLSSQVPRPATFSSQSPRPWTIRRHNASVGGGASSLGSEDDDLRLLLQESEAEAAADSEDEAEDEDEAEPPAEPVLGPLALQRFLETNAGEWRGQFVQFDFSGQPLQAIPVALSASASGTKDATRLRQTLQVQPRPKAAAEAEGTGSTEGGLVEVEVPEMNRITVDTRHQVGYFEDECAYALSHLTAELLARVIEAGAQGEEAAEEVPRAMRLPTDRPALVSEVCLSSLARPGSRVRAFHVLDPRGLIDTIAVFLEGGQGSPAPELLHPFSVNDLLGAWEGSAKVLRSDLYGGTREEQKVRTVYSLEGETLTVENARGARVLQQRGLLTSNVVQFNGGLQTVFVPGGMAFTFPQVVPRGSSFFFEFAWLEPGSQVRQRIVRTYDADGMVVSTSLLHEKKSA